jgi:hypothetical protein
MTPFGINTHGRQDNLEMYLHGIGCAAGSLDWIDIFQNREQVKGRCKEGYKISGPKIQGLFE